MYVCVLFLNLNNNYILGMCEDKFDFLGNMMC